MRILIILAILCFAGIADAGSVSVVVGQPTAAASGPLLSENFTTGSAPSGWTAASTYILYNYTTGDTYPLEGDYSFALNTDGTGSLYVTSASFTASGDVYASTMYSFSTATPGDITSIFVLRDASNNALCSVQHGIDNNLDGLIAGGTQVANFLAVTADTPVYLKMRYQKGTGANAVCTFWSSTDGSTWTAEGSTTNGTSTADATNLLFGASSSSNNQQVYDAVRVSTSDINY